MLALLRRKCITVLARAQVFTLLYVLMTIFVITGALTAVVDHIMASQGSKIKSLADDEPAEPEDKSAACSMGILFHGF